MADYDFYLCDAPDEVECCDCNSAVRERDAKKVKEHKDGSTEWICRSCFAMYHPDL